MQRIKYLALGITCFLLGGALLQPVFAQYSVSDLEKIFVRKSWMKSYLSKYYASKGSTYTKTQANSRYYTKTQADSRYVNTTSDTMTGTLTASNFALSSARTSHVTIPASAFKPTAFDGTADQAAYEGPGTKPNIIFHKTAGASGITDLVAPVVLPDDVKVTKIKYSYYDADAVNNSTVNFIGNMTGNGSPIYYGDVSSSGDGTLGSAEESLSPTVVIDNENCQYYLLLQGTGPTFQNSCQAVTIEFQYSTF